MEVRLTFQSGQRQLVDRALVAHLELNYGVRQSPAFQWSRLHLPLFVMSSPLKGQVVVED